MRYLLALLCPPLAILLCGKPIQAIICVPLYFLYFPAALWALFVVSSHKADVRNRALMKNAEKHSVAQVKAIERQTRELTRSLREQHVPEIVIQVPQPVQARPLPSPTPAQIPAPARQVVASPAQPKQPLITGEDIHAFISRGRTAAVRAKEGAVFAYQNLPEWAQPIAWGLAAATPISLVIVILFLSRR